MTAIDQLRENVKKHGLPSIVAFSGKEKALIEEGLSFLRAQALSGDFAALNHHKLSADQDDLDQMKFMLHTVPMFEERRLIELHCAERLQEHDVSFVVEYIKKPSPSSLLILVFDKIDKRSKLASSLLNAGLLIDLEINNKTDLAKIIIDEFANYNIVINMNVAQYLMTIFDDDLLAIKSAIEKLSLVYNNQEISIDEIEEHLVGHSEQIVFSLVRAISEGKLGEALIALWRVRTNQENALKFLGLLAWQLRTLVHIRHLLDDGMTEPQIRKTVGIFGDRFLWMFQCARKRPMEFHVKRLLRLSEYDRALKSTQTNNPFTLIEKLIYQSVIGI